MSVQIPAIQGRKERMDFILVLVGLFLADSMKKFPGQGSSHNSDNVRSLPTRQSGNSQRVAFDQRCLNSLVNQGKNLIPLFSPCFECGGVSFLSSKILSSVG